MYPGNRGRFNLNFSSAIFLFFFLPFAFLGDRFLGNTRARRPFLALAGLIFYAFGQLAGLAILLLNAAVTWLAGRSIARGGHRAAAAGAIAFDLALLGAFKYLDFFTGSLNAAFGLALPSAGLVLPIGISFFTFKSISYLADTARAPERGSAGFLDVLLYLSWFPEVTSGPITRFSQFAEGLPTRRVTSEQTARGLRRLTVGLARKLLIAGPVAAIADAAFGAAAPDFRLAWLGAAAYTIQIYFDFSGYSDMAIGLGRMFGFHFLENFNYPYISRSVTEFWRRWHISLSTWFRDYVYIPLGGNRVPKGRWILNILIVWTLTGFWHGAQWNFLLWGLYYAVLLLAEKLIWGKLLRKLPKLLQWLYAMFFVVVGWVLFDLTDFAQLKYALGIMFSYTPTNWSLLLASDTTKLFSAIFIIPAIVFSFPVAKKLRVGDGTVSNVAVNIVCLLLLAASIMFIISSSYNPFIYFRF